MHTFYIHISFLRFIHFILSCKRNISQINSKWHELKKNSRKVEPWVRLEIKLATVLPAQRTESKLPQETRQYLQLKCSFLKPKLSFPFYADGLNRN